MKDGDILYSAEFNLIALCIGDYVEAPFGDGYYYHHILIGKDNWFLWGVGFEKIGEL